MVPCVGVGPTWNGCRIFWIVANAGMGAGLTWVHRPCVLTLFKFKDIPIYLSNSYLIEWCMVNFLLTNSQC